MRLHAALALGTLSLLVLAGCPDEKLDEPIPIPPSAAPSASAELVVQGGAGGEGHEGGGGGAAPVAKKPTGTVDPLRIAKCCAALESNKKNAPPNQVGGYDVAIAACHQAQKNPALIKTLGPLAQSIPACR
ncbi:MAG: hypothetical protein KC731_17005 [Myxococcales bacterium]|nr:hypothetical protein [Myxococcales bacterium]